MTPEAHAGDRIIAQLSCGFQLDALGDVGAFLNALRHSFGSLTVAVRCPSAVYYMACGFAEGRVAGAAMERERASRVLVRP